MHLVRISVRIMSYQRRGRMLTTEAKQRKVFACRLATRDGWNTRTIGIDATLLAQEIMGHLLTHDPDMLLAEYRRLVNWTVLVTPSLELDPIVGERDIVYTADVRESYAIN